MTSDKPTVKTAETTIDIIQALQELNGARIEELAAYLEISPSTAYRHLITLKERYYVRKEGDEYHLALRFLTLGGSIRANLPGFEHAKEKVDQLATETGERSQFIVEEHGFRIYAYTQTGENAVQTDAVIGKRGLLHTSAAGKAILANLPRERVEQIIDRHGLAGETDETITDEEELFQELSDISERGYAYNIEESTVGLRAIGTAITSPNDEIVGAISISGPAHRLKGDRFRSELPNLILGSANEVELQIEYS